MTAEGIRWKYCFGRIAVAFFDVYKLDYKQFATEYGINDSTVRRWFNGDTCPNYKSQKEGMPLRSLITYIDIQIRQHDIDVDAEKLLHNHACMEMNDEEIEYFIMINQKSESFAEFVKKALIDCSKESQKIGSRHKSAAKNNRPVLSKWWESTQAVFFDFDGTLTLKGSDGRTTWENMWTRCGYDVKECYKLHKQYERGDISHQTWCDITAEKFIVKGFNKSILDDMSKDIVLIPKIEDVFLQLKSRGIEIYVVSGSVKYLIEETLKGLCEYIEDIQANDFVFDKNGLLVEIKETPFDFGGKPRYIQEIVSKKKIKNDEVLFIGNSDNDEWVKKSGFKALCINPSRTSSHDKKKWTDYIRDCNRLDDIMKI